MLDLDDIDALARAANVLKEEMGGPSAEKVKEHISNEARGFAIERVVSIATAAPAAFGLRAWVEPLNRNFEPDRTEELPRFRVGDRIAICAKVAVACDLLIVTVGATGRAKVVFPAKGATGRVAAGTEVRRNGSLMGQPGIDEVFVFASDSPVSLSIEHGAGVVSGLHAAVNDRIRFAVAKLEYVIES
jgi:hypothetical protein